MEGLQPTFEQKVLTYKGQVVFEKLTMSTFTRMPKFFQKDEACFMFINKGEFSVRTPNEFISFDQNRGLLAKCFNYFFETNKQQREASEVVEILGILIYPEMVEELFQFDLKQSHFRVDYIANQVVVDGLLANFRDGLNILLDNPQMADELMVRNKIKEFVLLMSKTENALSELDFLSALFKSSKTEFKRTIANNVYSSLALDEFAHLCGLSLSSFKRQFAEIYRESPKRYIQKTKLEKASKMLADKHLRISDVAYDCGYESLSTFYRNFQKKYGIGPSDYRNSLAEPK
ncbi:AraC family transcriptional regulator [Flavobacteriales bacterium]|nr:AraC family transcriptional regulator [Flavobacteriales bacterium]